MTSLQNPDPPILSIDWGDRRIGVSISPDGKHSAIRETLEVASPADGIKKVVELIKQEQVKTLLVGLPLTLRAEIGAMALRIEAHGKEIAEKSGVALEYIDERETTNFANRMKQSYPGYAVDSIVALLLLEEYLAKQPGNTSY